MPGLRPAATKIIRVAGAKGSALEFKARQLVLRAAKFVAGIAVCHCIS